MSRERRREMVHRQHPALSTVRQCALVGISRSSLYYRRKGTSPEDLRYGGDRPAIPGHALLRVAADEGLAAETRPPGQQKKRPAFDADHGTCGHLSAVQDQQSGAGHELYPYQLGGMDITRPNQVWAADITYIPMASGLLYLAAIMDWYSRYVVAWNLSNTLDAQFCVEALEEALEKGRPDVFNTDQGSQFTSEAFTGCLDRQGVRISMDGKGRYSDNIFVERLWRTVKYETVYLKAYTDGRQAKADLAAYFRFYNTQRPHQALGYRTPVEVFNGDLVQSSEHTAEGGDTKVLMGSTLVTFGTMRTYRNHGGTC